MYFTILVYHILHSKTCGGWGNLTHSKQYLEEVEIIATRLSLIFLFNIILSSNKVNESNQYTL